MPWRAVADAHALHRRRRLPGSPPRPGRRVAVHVKVDTGMHRVGVYPPERRGARSSTAWSAVGLDRRRTVDASRDAREEDVPTTDEQLDRFLQVVDEAARAPAIAPAMLHAANTGGALLHPATPSRPGAPRDRHLRARAGPRRGAGRGCGPLSVWRSAVSMVKRLPAGERTSYGHRYRAGTGCLDRDGAGRLRGRLPSSGYRPGAEVLIGGRRCRVAGTRDDGSADGGLRGPGAGHRRRGRAARRAGDGRRSPPRSWRATRTRSGTRS